MQRSTADIKVPRELLIAASIVTHFCAATWAQFCQAVHRTTRENCPAAVTPHIHNMCIQTSRLDRDTYTSRYKIYSRLDIVFFMFRSVILLLGYKERAARLLQATGPANLTWGCTTSVRTHPRPDARTLVHRYIDRYISIFGPSSLPALKNCLVVW